MSQPINLDSAEQEHRDHLTKLYAQWKTDAANLKLVVEMRDYLQANGFIVSAFQGCCNGWMNQVTAWVGWYINKWKDEK